MAISTSPSSTDTRNPQPPRRAATQCSLGALTSVRRAALYVGYFDQGPASAFRSNAVSFFFALLRLDPSNGDGLVCPSRPCSLGRRRQYGMEAIALSFGILRGMHHCTSAARGVCRVHPGWLGVLFGSVRSSQLLDAQAIAICFPTILIPASLDYHHLGLRLRSQCLGNRIETDLTQRSLAARCRG